MIRGRTVGEILAESVPDYSEVVAATLNNHLVDLHTPVSGTATVAPVRRGHPEGRRVIQRTAALVLQAAAARLDLEAQLVVGQSLFGGYFYELRGKNGEVDLDDLARRLTAAIEELVEADVEFDRFRVSVEGAATTLTDPDGTKARLLEAWAAATIAVVRVDGFVDVQHGPVAPSSRHARGARVVAYPPGLVLQFPGGDEALGPNEGRHLYGVYSETRVWNRRLGVETIGDLNQAVLADDMHEVVRVAEALHEKKIAEIADAIAARQGEVRVVSVAGPSSAGKTTFVRRLSVQLRVNGIHPVMVGLDDYYRDRRDCPVDADGEYDLEALEALDLALIHEQLAALLRGEEVRIPKFDFKVERPADPESWRPLRLADDQVLLIEGIHGLNPRLTEPLPDETRFRVYVNALTGLVLDCHNRVHTTDTRLLRRIVRDRRYRGTRADETIERWPSVRRGEESHIFPFESEADATFNSALVYETAVLKSFAWRYLLEVPRNHPSRVRAHELLSFLEFFVPVFPDDVPANSVLREFIGGSGFSY